VVIGVYTFECHLPDAHSLKGKRQVLRRLKDRLRARHNVSVAELSEHGDLWQRATIAVVSVSESRDALVRLFQAVEREAQTHVLQVLAADTEFIESADGGPGGWSGDWS
jgi:uncharacterized protein YlxP (DUF503 family)